MASQGFQAIQDEVQASLVAVTKSAHALGAEDLQFHRNANSEVNERLDDANENLLSLAQDILKSATRNTKLRAPQVQEPDDIDTRWRGIVDIVDSLLERADMAIDEYTGLIQRKESLATAHTYRNPRSGVLESSVLNAKNLKKPQLAFEKKPNNFPDSPWKPMLTNKPHATTSLAESLQTFETEDSGTQYKHPYEQEILNYSFPPEIYTKQDPIPYLPLESTAAIWVDTFEGVLEMLEELKQANEIAVDLEHHDRHSYLGLLSLMQISTREKDWVVDTLKPWRHQLEILNDVFANPNILKVFHGSFMDMIWLQRDLGLYIVGLFDTYHAAETLHYQSRGLAYLLKRFVDFDADKKYQRADWRIRPLTEEMLKYARCDTHFLLYVYDLMRNELVDANAKGDAGHDHIEWVLVRSKEYALQRYENPTYGPDGMGPRGWFNSRLPHYTPEQFAVYRAVHKWRDDLARKEDESTNYIMPGYVLDEISRIIPKDPKALSAMLSKAALPAKSLFNQLFTVITESLAPPSLPSMSEVLRAAKRWDTDDPTTREPVDKQPDMVEDITGDVNDLIIKESQLWGKIKMSSRYEADGMPKPNRGEVVVPWAMFIGNSVPGEAPIGDEPEVGVSVKASAQPQAKEEESLDGEFTLKMNARKRKSNVLQEEPADTSSSDEDTTSDENSDTESEDKAEGQEKRQDKMKGVEYEAFDYSKAKSVIKGNKSAASQKNQGDKPTKPKFDPFSGGEIKGARRHNYEKTGRSQTFRG